MKTRPAKLLLSTVLAGLMTLLAAGCNKPPDTSGPPPPGTSVGAEIDDVVLTTNVKSALLADPDVKSFDIKVDTRKGDVQLSGFVDSQSQLDRALTIARGVTGVHSVHDSMTLKAAATTVGNKVDDSIVTTRVKSALLADLSIKSFDIAVVTRKGDVQLSGFVNNQSQIDNAIAIAKGTAGVSSVINEMSLKK